SAPGHADVPRQGAVARLLPDVRALYGRARKHRRAMAQSGEYLLGTSHGERERLLKQCEIFRPQARWLLGKVGIQPGWRAVDVGCGPLGIVDLLAERVGPAGNVVGFERDPRMLEWLRASLTERNLTNVEPIQGDASAIDLSAGSFDFVHERFVLLNVLNP